MSLSSPLSPRLGPTMNSPPTLTQLQPTETITSPELGDPVAANPLASAALYLYTFLATLLLLVSISTFLIIRAIIQRRRRRRAVREALLWYTNDYREGDRNRLLNVGMNGWMLDLTKKPRMWEVHLASTAKPIDPEKMTEGKLISSSWKSNYHLAWSSILPLSSILLSPTILEDGNQDVQKPGSNTEDIQRRRGLGRFFRRVPHWHNNSSAQSSGSRPSNTPDSALPSSSPANVNVIESLGDGMHTSASLHRAETYHGQPEERNPHIYGSSGSSYSGSRPPQHSSHLNSDPNANMNEMPPNPSIGIGASTRQTSDSGPPPLEQSGVGDSEADIPTASTSSQTRIVKGSHPQTAIQIQNQSHKNFLLGGMKTDADKPTQIRVAVLVRMPSPPPSISARSTSSPLPKDKEKLGFIDEKRLSSSSGSTLGSGGCDLKNMDTISVVEMPFLEVGLMDVDVFPSFGGERG